MKRFKAKGKKKRKFKGKFLLFVVLFFFSFHSTYCFLEKSDFKISDKVLVKILLEEQNSHKKEKSGILDAVKEVIVNPTFLLNSNYKNLVKLEKEVKKEETNETLTKEKADNVPLIYIYNTHQTEAYMPSSIAEYSVTPTVLVGSYILQERLEEKGYSCLVEERSIPDILNANHWNYASSYQASRMYLDDVKNKNSSLRYFIDFHRDSLPYDKTTIQIEGVTYAKLLFLIGLENPNYEKNLAFTERINAKLDEKYPGLSKGIYKKGGEGVNGVYNQDNSEYTILVEVGGEENKIDEVLHSVNAFSEVFSEVISTSAS